jgi:prophage tail gpP-like protein
MPIQYPSPQPTIGPNPREVATVQVGAAVFTDWETIWLQHRLAESHSIFRFTCAERDPIPGVNEFQKLQWRPGDPAAVLLGGVPAFAGVIIERQVAYDGTSHSVQLTGKGQTYWGAESSVDTTDNNGNFDGMTVQQVYETVFGKYPGGKLIWGTPNPRPFPYLSCQPGEKNWDFVERICRPRGMVLGSDFAGNYLLIGPHTPPLIYRCIEGENIKKLQMIWNKDYFKTSYGIQSQAQGSDDQNGTAASEMECQVHGNANIHSELHTPAEQPVKTKEELCERAQFEQIWVEGAEIECHVTVQGWFPPGFDDIWRVGMNVYIWSPMACLDMILKIQTATFTQDNNSGTQTELELVLPWKLRGQAPYNVGKAGVPQDPVTNPTPAPTPSQVQQSQQSPFEPTPQQWQDLVAGITPTS